MFIIVFIHLFSILYQLQVYLSRKITFFCSKLKFSFVTIMQCNPSKLVVFINPPLFFKKQVICVHDVSSIYRVPLLLEEQGVVDYFLRRLDLPVERQSRKMLIKWKEMADRFVISSWACICQSLLGLHHAVIMCRKGAHRKMFRRLTKDFIPRMWSQHRGGSRQSRPVPRTSGSEFRSLHCAVLSHQLNSTNSSLVAEGYMYFQSLQECWPWRQHS